MKNLADNQPDPNDLSTYDILECPHCDKKCKPVKVKKTGTVVYEKHECTSGGYSFSIDKDGNLIE